MDEESDAEEFESIPNRDVDPVRLYLEIARLQRRVAELESAEHVGVEKLPASTFHALTGFADVAAARAAFDNSGGEAYFGSLRRHDSPLAADDLVAARDHLLHQLTGCAHEVEAAFNVVSARRSHSEVKETRRGPRPKVDAFHLFLLPFMFVHGGVLEAWAPFLPGVGVSQSQFSRLLAVAGPAVARKWASMFYCKRDLRWLLVHARPSQRTPPILADARRADIVLFIDGAPLETEKSDGGYEQKVLYDWSKDSMPILRVLVVSAADGTIVEVSDATGGRTTEVTVAHSMHIIERLEREAAEQQRRVHLHFIVDRGFFDFVAAVRASRWDHLTVTTDIPFHLNPPVGRGKYERGAPKRAKRKQHESGEVDYNRSVAAQRWINEVAVGALKRSRLFRHRIDLSIVHNIGAFLEIAAALANYRIEMKRPL